MIHQLQLGSHLKDGPVLVPVDSPIEVLPEDGLVLEPIQLDLMLFDPSELDSPELTSPGQKALDEIVSDVTISPPEPAANPIDTDDSLDWLVEDWAVQSLQLDEVGATHYVVGAQSRRRSSPPLELIGVGVLGATLLSGFAIADNAKQVAQTPATPGLSRTAQPGRPPIIGMKPGGLSIQPSSIQPELVRPEMALPPPPVMVSKSLTSMAGLSVVPMGAVTSTTGSMTTGTATETVSTLGLTTGPRSLRPVQLAEPTLVSVARSQAAINAAVALPEPPTMQGAEPIGEESQIVRPEVAPAEVTTAGTMLADRPMVSQVTPEWSVPAQSATEVVPVPRVDRAAEPLLSPSGVPLADPVVPMPPVSLGESQGAIPLAVMPPESIVGQEAVRSEVAVAPADGQGVRSLSQAEAIAVLGARSDSEMGRFVHQSLNARDYALAAQAQSLGTVPPFGFVDYQNQRIVLPSDLTAALPGAQLQSMEVSAATAN
jgi:hypothetical protein